MTTRWTAGCGILLLGLGFLLFLSSAGLVAIDFWKVLFPLFLIAMGGLTIWLAVRGGSEIPETNLAVPLGGSREARIRIRYGAGRLTVGAGAASGQLVEVDARGGVVNAAGGAGPQTFVDLRPPAEFLGGVLAPWRWAGGDPPNWNVRLAPGIPLRLEVEAGACDMRLDLSDLTVRDLDLSTGASSTRLTMPRAAGTTTARIRAGAAEVKILVPEGVAARIVTQTGLGDVRVDRQRFSSTAGGLGSPDYATAQNRLDLVLEVGAGSVHVS